LSGASASYGGPNTFTGGSLEVTFDSVQVAVVPLPAAGWLLVSADAGLGFRRRQA
jgi:hypothetical protein